MSKRQRVHFVSSQSESEAKHFRQIDELIRSERPFALLADKGMPCFLDPGLKLVRHLLENHQERIELIPLGASSAMDAAIMISGVDCTQFVFLGSFPDCRSKGKEVFSKKFPNIVYVSAVAWLDFIRWLKELAGDNARHGTLMVFSNIRQLRNRRRASFSLSEPLERFRSFWDENKDKSLKPELENLVAILHWQPPATRPQTEKNRQEEKDYFYVYLNKAVCDANCIFCSRAEPAFKERISRESAGWDYQAELEALREQIRNWPNPGVFHIGGHEPAIYPTVVPLVQEASRRGFSQILMETNGIALADRRLVEELQKAGLHEVRLPIYGVSADVHDLVTGVPGSFEKLMRAQENLAACGIAFSLKTVVLRQNLHQLDALLYRYPKAGCSFVMPHSNRIEDYRKVCPRLSEVPAEVLDRIGNIYLPCIFKKREHPSTKTASGGWVVLASGEVVYQGSTENLSEEQMAQRLVKPERCRGCLEFDLCSGIYPLYLEVHGQSELVPYE